MVPACDSATGVGELVSIGGSAPLKVVVSTRLTPWGNCSPYKQRVAVDMRGHRVAHTISFGALLVILEDLGLVSIQFRRNSLLQIYNLEDLEQHHCLLLRLTTNVSPQG